MIESIAHDAVTMPDARTLQRLNDDIRDFFAHGIRPCFNDLGRNVHPDAE
jgi:hypothetical protein